MKFSVEGANRNTGSEERLVIEANTPAEAEAEANRRGLMVERCQPALAGASAVTATVKRLISTAWSKPYGRIGMILAPIVIIGLMVVLIGAKRENAANRKAADEAIEANYRRAMKGADKTMAQAEDMRQQAAEMRAKAARLRGEAAAQEVSPSASQMTKSQAIDDDALISVFLDQYPDLRSKMMSYKGLGGDSLDVSLNLLVSAGKLTPSDVRYIRTFAGKLRSLPN